MDLANIFGLKNLNVDGEKLIFKVHNKKSRSVPNNFRVRKCPKSCTTGSRGMFGSVHSTFKSLYSRSFMQELTEMRSRLLSWDVLKASFPSHHSRTQQQTACWITRVKASFRTFSSNRRGISGASQLYCN